MSQQNFTYREVRDLLQETLNRPIAFHRAFATLCNSVTAGLMLSQAYYWSVRSTRPDHSFYKTREEWTEETCLSRYEQESARKILSGLKTPDGRSLWREERRGVPPVIFYIIDLTAVIDLVLALQQSATDVDSPDLQDMENMIAMPPKRGKNPQLNGGKTTEQSGEKPPFLYTENTSEITSEIEEKTDLSLDQNKGKAQPQNAGQDKATGSKPSPVTSQATNAGNVTRSVDGSPQAASKVAQAVPVIPASNLAAGEYMPGIPDPRQQPQTGIVGKIDSYREQWRKLGFNEKDWQAYCRCLSDACKLTALINASDNELELNNVRSAALTLIKLGYGSIDQLKDLLALYAKDNAWKQGPPTLQALTKFASARFVDPDQAAEQAAAQEKVVFEFNWVNPFYPEEKNPPVRKTCSRAVFEKEWKGKCVMRIISGYPTAQG